MPARPVHRLRAIEKTHSDAVFYFRRALAHTKNSTIACLRTMEREKATATTTTNGSNNNNTMRMFLSDFCSFKSALYLCENMAEVNKGDNGNLEKQKQKKAKAKRLVAMFLCFIVFGGLITIL